MCEAGAREFRVRDEPFDATCRATRLESRYRLATGRPRGGFVNFRRGRGRREDRSPVTENEPTDLVLVFRPDAFSGLKPVAVIGRAKAWRAPPENRDSFYRVCR